jgi:FtsP/CotA-like multicopper oxidase with cupredoxin domain
MDGSGYARGTLAPREGMRASVPPMDAGAHLTLADIAMAELMESMRGMADASTGENNKGVDMRVNTPDLRLDDPGVGLRENGRRVLTCISGETCTGCARAAVLGSRCRALVESRRRRAR